jgi:cell division septum initiation protein DivIVA
MGLQSEGTLNKIVALLEENVQLKQRNKDLERKLNQSENKNQVRFTIPGT